MSTYQRLPPAEGDSAPEGTPDGTGPGSAALWRKLKWPLRGLWTQFGWSGLGYFALSKLNGKPCLARVASRGLRYPFYFRTHTTDILAYGQVFLQRTYDLRFAQKPAVIVDCGANIGLTSVYYANRFRRSRILAFEPEPENFRLLERNVRPYPRVTPIHSAVWSENRELVLYDDGRDSGAWGFRVAEALPAPPAREVGRVRALTIDRIMSEHGLEWIDLLKVDVEGAEAAIFSNPEPWIGRVGVIAVECHERRQTGCEAAVIGAAGDFQVRFRRNDVHVFGRSGLLRTNPTWEWRGGADSGNRGVAGRSGGRPRGKRIAGQ